MTLPDASRDHVVDDGVATPATSRVSVVTRTSIVSVTSPPAVTS